MMKTETFFHFKTSENQALSQNNQKILSFDVEFL
jgi:hypothetical protein